MSRRTLVQNAGSDRQVQRAARTEKDRRARYLFALREQLRTPLGRLVQEEQLAKFGLHESVWHDHGARMARNVGRQDCAHELLADCIEADPDQAEVMLREGRDRRQRDRGEPVGNGQEEQDDDQ